MTSATSAASTSKYFTADHQVRVSKVVGASVYNDQNQSVGSIDDILMSDNDHKADTVVISVGGFLGMGSKLVSVPFDQLKIQDDKIVMPGATKASLEGMPEYHYSNAYHRICQVSDFGWAAVCRPSLVRAWLPARHKGCQDRRWRRRRRLTGRRKPWRPSYPAAALRGCSRLD